MVTSGVICGGPKLIINMFSLFTVIEQIVERTKRPKVFILTPLVTITPIILLLTPPPPISPPPPGPLPAMP